MDRIIVGTAGTITVTFTSDETTIDAAGTVTVAGVGLDGSTVFSGSATHSGAVDSGLYTFLVTPTIATQPDVVTVSWTGTFAGVSQTVRTVVAFVGGVYFTIGQLRAWEPTVASTTAYTLGELQGARTWAETRAEQIMGRSYVRSVTKKTFRGTGVDDMPLGGMDARTIRAVTVDGVAQSTSSYTLINPVYYPVLRGSWPVDATCTVIWEHGAEWVPEPIARAVAALAAFKATEVHSAISSRAKGWVSEAGLPFMALAMPSTTETGLPNVDAVLKSVAVPGFA